jgi:aminopeptidase N
MTVGIDSRARAGALLARIPIPLALVATLAAATPAGAQRPGSFGGYRPGSAGLGDPFFPLAGNSGYDVEHYELTLDYVRTTNLLTATAEIVAHATRSLSSFHLDLRGFTISRLLVENRPAAFLRQGQELVVLPEKGLLSGQDFRVVIDYAGTPTIVTDPDGSIEGWVPTSDGAFVVCEPQGAPAWFPANDNPRDKATFQFNVTVPAGLTVVGNGVLVSSTTASGKTTWVWREDDPMSPYLSTVTLGLFDLTISTLPNGIPSYVAVDKNITSSRAVLNKIPDIIAYYESIYGPYPFTSVGAIVDIAGNVGYALETQSKPCFPSMPGESTLAHELAHQWFGDSVTLEKWPDIWLHEGFATWSEWIWSEHKGGTSAQATFNQLYARPNLPSIWNPPPGNPGSAANLFTSTVYDRGGMTLQALRTRVGDAVFFRILQDWAAENRHANATTADFITLAERDSGLELDAFFQTWLFTPGKPTAN